MTHQVVGSCQGETRMIEHIGISPAEEGWTVANDNETCLVVALNCNVLQQRQPSSHYPAGSTRDVVPPWPLPVRIFCPYVWVCKCMCVPLLCEGTLCTACPCEHLNFGGAVWVLCKFGVARFLGAPWPRQAWCHLPRNSFCGVDAAAPSQPCVAFPCVCMRLWLGPCLCLCRLL
jgi:hypothetical protein